MPFYCAGYFDPHQLGFVYTSKVHLFNLSSPGCCVDNALQQGVQGAGETKS